MKRGAKNEEQSIWALNFARIEHSQAETKSLFENC